MYTDFTRLQIFVPPTVLLDLLRSPRERDSGVNC